MSTQPFKTLVLGLLQQGHRDEEVFVQSLSESERTASGTWERWAAKDHLSHRTFWCRNLIRKLTAVLQHQELAQDEEDEEQLNAQNFAQQQRPWSDILAESEQTYAELIALTEQLSEEDLATPNRFPWFMKERPLYVAFLGSCYEHEQEHLAQYYLDHDNLPRAIEIRERCADRILQTQVPDWIKGYFLYNLACFYTKLKQFDKASTLLQEALTLAPRLQELSQSDPELAALRDAQK
ncbi:TPR end-of-group domain-containing protein [Dictyobacter aurantiacus]|uniref:DinB-like domain-containing protein n=1 Tax=Dictyobacter aurantiacus TaxID=1936993 RepID=A0A401ZNH7_9CHLR|nr:DinB family protein [Dictyobacter aurantiacus]GCE08403.1 hypothetical protein KDAU_57320 [Dictyobacter aurantiacus]